MGGLSKSRLDIQNDRLVFEGELSTENRGGFVSVLARMERPLNNATHYAVNTSGDGRRYQLRLRHGDTSRDVAWRAFFSTRKKINCVHFESEEFHPVVRGQPAIVARPLSLTPIHFIGFMLTSRKPGPFWLNIHSLHVGRENS
jgi:hypothetical protein